MRRVFNRRRFKFLVRVQHRSGIAGPRPRIQIAEHLVAALVCNQFGHFAGLVIDVAEGDGGGRARLLAGGDDFAVGNGAIFLVGLDARRGDALHTEAALLHDAAGTHADVGIAHQGQALVAKVVHIGIEQEVEPPHLIGAVVGAIARAHAAVVDHGVEAFGRVHRCADWADLLTGRVFAVLAHHGLEEAARRGQVALEVSVDAQPLHVAADANLLLADHGDVVLGVTAHDAGIAAGATVHVDRHAPGVFFVLPVGEHGDAGVGLFAALALAGEVWMRLEFAQRGVADDAARAERLVGFERVVGAPLRLAEGLAAVVLEVTLGHRYAPLAVEFLDRAGCVEGRVRGADGVGVEAGPRAYAAGSPAAIAEVDRDGIVGMAWGDDHRCGDFAATDSDLDDVVFFEIPLGQCRARD